MQVVNIHFYPKDLVTADFYIVNVNKNFLVSSDQSLWAVFKALCMLMP